MQSLRNLKIGTRLALAFGTVLALLIGVAGVGVLVWPTCRPAWTTSSTTTTSRSNWPARCARVSTIVRSPSAQVRRVGTLIGEISSASAEQSQGIGQIGDAVNQLDQVTQQNAALVEESAAAAESLSQQASKLAAAVGRFRLAA